MIKNYFLLAYRNLLSNRVASFINIFGLSIAVACCITVFLFLKNYWTLDDFHEKGDRIFMVEYTTETNGMVQTYGDAPAPLADMLKNDFPQVEYAVRMEREQITVINKDNTLNELLTYADTDFFHVFTFPLKYGNAAALSDPGALILSSDMADKYFPGQMPVGQTLKIMTTDRQQKQFTVQGVAEPFPNNAGFSFDLLTGYHPVHEILKNQDWKTRLSGLFILTKTPQDADLLAGQMSRYAALFNTNNPEEPIQSFVFDNLRHPAPDAYRIMRRPSEARHPFVTTLFSLIALAMLGLSCFNYVNISLGGVTRRLKEIGIRKVMGGKRSQLIAQFMTENLLLCFAALLLGLAITSLWLVPLFNRIMTIHISLSFAQNLSLWIFLAGMLAVVAVASGAYPALYVSAFKPRAVLAGKQQFSDKSTFRRGLLALQFTLAFFAVIAGVVLTYTGRQWEKSAWGYQPEGVLAVQLTDSTQFSLMKNRLLENPSVTGIAGSADHVGVSWNKEEVFVGDNKQDIVRYNVGSDYLEALGFGLAAGRFFDPNRPAEDAQSVIVNESFVKKQSWDQAPGQSIRIGQKNYTVAGVVRDFKMIGSGATRPALFLSAPTPQFGYLLVRFEPEAGKKVAADVDRIWQGLSTGVPVKHFFQQDVFEGFNTSFRNVSKSFGYIAALALLIACMGLYGLAAQHFSRRMKEVSIRKVLGASVARIALLINREFLMLLLIAGGAATVLSFVGIQILFRTVSEFTGAFTPGIWPFLAADVLVLVTAALAVGKQSWQMTQLRLSETLKNSE